MAARKEVRDFVTLFSDYLYEKIMPTEELYLKYLRPILDTYNNRQADQFTLKNDFDTISHWLRLLYAPEDEVPIRYLKDAIINLLSTALNWGITLSDKDFLKGYEDIKFVRDTNLADYVRNFYGKDLRKSFEDDLISRPPFQKAMEKGYIIKVENGYRWNDIEKRGEKSKFAYFIEKLYGNDYTDGFRDKFKGEHIPFKPIQVLFNFNKGSLLTLIQKLHEAKKPQKWRKEIDELFEN